MNTPFDSKITRVLLLSGMLSTAVTVASAADSWLEIGTLSELQQFASDVNAGKSSAINQNVRLTADITLPNGWTPIGSSSSSSSKGFHGTFDGQGHTLTFDDVTASDTCYSVFGHCWSASIKNLHTTGTIHTAKNKAAGIVGRMGATTIQGCSSDVNIYSTCSGVGYDAGIVADVATTTLGTSYIEDCYFSGLIDGGGKSTYLSGILGYSHTADHYLRNCLMTGTLQNVVTGGALHALRTGWGTESSYANNYILDPDGTRYDASHYDYANRVNESQLLSGEICYYLDADHNATWGQTLGTDREPSPLSSAQVFLFNSDCSGNITPYCSNTNSFHSGTNVQTSSCSACQGMYESHLVINEIMQSNVTSLLTEHDFADSWVELYNPTDADININGYYLGASATSADDYKFPVDSIVPAHGYLRIDCDKKEARLHTDFRLESADGGELYLLDASGSVIDHLQYPAMIAVDVAYGRIWDGLDNWGWQWKATPRQSNTGQTTSQLLPEPVFSVESMLVDADHQRVKLSLPEESLPYDTRIYYTTDGSEPDFSSTSTTYLSTSLTESTVIRAKLMSAFALSRPSTTHTFIFHPRQTSLPIISIATSDDYLYSDDIGMLSNHVSLLEGEEYLYSSSDYHLTECATIGQENYWYPWRRPINIEYLNGDEEGLSFNQIGEAAISGWASRDLTQKSFKVYANKRFGTKRFKGQFWSDKTNVTKSKSFILRSGGQNSNAARINDAMVQHLFGTHLENLDYQAYRPTIVYINGVYKGLFNMRERSEEDYVEANYDGLEDIEQATEDQYKGKSLPDNFAQFYNLYRSSSATYAQLEAMMDVDNFREALIAEMFSNNTDFPHNNVSMWRPLAEDGKWRWILKDIDYFGHANYHVPMDFNMFYYMLGTPTRDTHRYEYDYAAKSGQCLDLYKKMISFDEFKTAFIDSYATYLGDFLRPSVTVALAQDMMAEIATEVEPTFAVYQEDAAGSLYPYEYDNYRNMTDTLIYYSQKRPAIIYQQMADFFSLGSVIPMSLKPNGASATINGTGLTEGSFDGAWFSNHTLTLNSGNSNKGWLMRTYKRSASGTMSESGSESFSSQEVSLLLGDYQDCDSVAFTVYAIHPSDFDIKLDELAINQGDCTNWSSQPTITLDEPQYAYANITGIDALPTSKTDDLQAYIDFYDNEGNYFRKRVLLNLQGSSEPKVNLSLQFCEDEWIGDETPDITFGDWVAQDEFHLKAFYEDGLRGTAEVAYQLYGKITGRDKCYPKAFPVSLYVNGDFYGVMSWQLKKHRKNMDLAKDNGDQVWLDGKVNNKQLFSGTVNWTKFEVRNPKDLYNMDGTDYDGDDPQEIMDATSSAYEGKKKQVRCATAKQHILELSQYCQELTTLKESGATSEEMRAAISERFDVDELINYKLFSLVTNNYDGFSENWQWFTYDGVQWTVAPYDCNLTFGYNEEGTSLWPASQGSKKYDYQMQNTDTDGPMPWLMEYFWSDLKARYKSLRDNGTISAAAIMTLVNDWYDRIGARNYDEEWEAWPESPCLTTFSESIDRFETWVEDRIALEDQYLGYTATQQTYSLAISQARWSTICLPFSFDVPADLQVYTVQSTYDDALELDQENYPQANHPYLVYGTAGKTYTLQGEVASSSTTSPTNGLLVGTLASSGTYAPVDSYVLQKQSYGLGFYHVASSNYIKVPQYKAYLSVPEGTTILQGHFRLADPETDGINEIASDQNVGKSAYYNYLGQPVEGATSGLVLKRMPDGTFRKVLILK